MEDLEIIIPVKNENKNIVRVLDSFFYEVKTKFTVTICFDDYKDTTILAIKKYDRKKYSSKLSSIRPILTSENT